MRPSLLSFETRECEGHGAVRSYRDLPYSS